MAKSEGQLLSGEIFRRYGVQIDPPALEETLMELKAGRSWMLERAGVTDEVPFIRIGRHNSGAINGQLGLSVDTQGRAEICLPVDDLARQIRIGLDTKGILRYGDEIPDSQPIKTRDMLASDMVHATAHWLQTRNTPGFSSLPEKADHLRLNDVSGGRSLGYNTQAHELEATAYQDMFLEERCGISPIREVLTFLREKSE